jgi:hypothetical protein
MPKGELHDEKTCPCGNAAGVFVSGARYSTISVRSLYNIEDWNKKSFNLPLYVQDFVGKFDRGDLPQYTR